MSKDEVFEQSELSFEQKENGDIYNVKNRYREKWTNKVDDEIINTLLVSQELKVSFVDKEGNLYSNFKLK